MRPFTALDVEAELAHAFASGDWGAVELLAGLLGTLSVPKAPVHPLEAALWYAEAGLRVFPCQERAKVPYAGTRGCHDATSDPATLRSWWADHPGANVAVATGHRVDVIDVDGEAGHVAWGEQFGGSWGGFTVLGTVSTPRPGGLHLYVAANGEGNHAGMLPGVDYRGRGGYVLAPPSRTDVGDYRFLQPLKIEDL